MSTSIRLSPTTRRRVARLAEARETTPHAFMLEAIEEKVAAEEAHAAFVAEARRRLSEMKKTGRGIPADEVFDYLLSRARGKPSKRPKARLLP